MQNPFKFGGEVSGYQFYDRTDLVETLRRRLTAGASNIVMIAPRRYGKTSLVAKVLRQIREKDELPAMMFDLSMVPTLSRFCEEYVNAVYAMAGGRSELIHRVAGWLANCDPTLSFGVDGVAKIKLNLRRALSESSLCEVLDLPERLAKELGTTFVIAFDEFQEVSDISREFALEKVFRSRLQRHERVHYVFFGSRTRMLERMFCDHARPFYNSALQMPLGKPPIEESRDFIRTRFADGGIYIGDTEVESILQVSENIPYYLQAISSFVYESAAVARRDSIVAADVERATDDLMALNANYYSALSRGLSESQKALVFALSKEPTHEFDEGYRVRHGLPMSSTLHSALKELIKDGIVEDANDTYRIGDPILSRYMRAALGRVIS